jgi:molecular chaperone DnaK
VFQGERKMAADNKLLGQFNLEGIAPAQRGLPQIEVTFDVDANGILHVSAKDKGTGKEQKIVIQSSGGLSDEEIKKMVKDAEENASKDEEKKLLIEARNKADSLIYSTEKSLKEFGDKIPQADKDEVERILSDLKSAMETDNVDDINNKVEALTQASMKIGQHVYGGQEHGGTSTDTNDSASSDSSSSDAEEKVVDAEYEEVKDGEDKNSK